MNLTKSYIEGVKQRIELVRGAFIIPTDDPKSIPSREFSVGNLLKYLEGLDYFVEEEKMRCEICKNPLYVRQDGSLVCVELHH